MESIQAVPNETLLKTIEELRTYEKKNLRINRVKLCCAVAAACLLVIVAIVLSVYIGRITKNIDELSAVMEEAGENINIVAEDLQKIDFEKLGSSIQLFADTGTETIGQIQEATKGLDSIMTDAGIAIKNISSINIAQLNESIQELHDVLQPIANAFNIFH